MKSHQYLLFGFVALESGTISKSEFITAVQQWLEKKERSLGEIFVDLEILTESERILIEKIVFVPDGAAWRRPVSLCTEQFPGPAISESAGSDSR